MMRADEDPGHGNKSAEPSWDSGGWWRERAAERVSRNHVPSILDFSSTSVSALVQARGTTRLLVCTSCSAIQHNIRFLLSGRPSDCIPPLRCP